MTIISLCNQKGGVGKTTIAVLLSDYLRHKYPFKKILLVDLDPQGSLSETFIFQDETAFTLLDYFTKTKALSDCLYSIDKNLDILPAHISTLSLPSIDFLQLKKMKKNFLSLFENYDYVIIDTRPSLDWLFRLGILLANYIFMPVIMSRYSYEALDEALNEINMVASESPDFQTLKVFENRGKQQKFILKETFRTLFKDRLGESFFKEVLPDAISVDERTAINQNYFEIENRAKAQIEKFFNSLMEELNG